MSLNRDQLAMARARETVQTAYAALSGAQSFPPHQQVMAYAVLLNEVCAELQLDPGQMLDAARRLGRHAVEHYSIEIAALRAFIRQELNK